MTTGAEVKFEVPSNEELVKRLAELPPTPIEKIRGTAPGLLEVAGGRSGGARAELLESHQFKGSFDFAIFHIEYMADLATLTFRVDVSIRVKLPPVIDLDIHIATLNISPTNPYAAIEFNQFGFKALGGIYLDIPQKQLRYKVCYQTPWQAETCAEGVIFSW